MHVAIREKSTGRVVSRKEVQLAGQNYQPTEAEHFDSAWKAAVADKEVDEDNRGNYVFIRLESPRG